jgi:hypothetical protein
MLHLAFDGEFGYESLGGLPVIKDASADDTQFAEMGFVEISVEAGMTSSTQFTAGCSGSRSACCTRTCSADPAFVGTADDWEAFLSVRGGEIQY